MKSNTGTGASASCSSCGQGGLGRPPSPLGIVDVARPIVVPGATPCARYAVTVAMLLLSLDHLPVWL